MKLSIIIPAYNQEDLIKKCLRSIPVRDDIEVIIVDDCSTDGTLDSIREVMKEGRYRIRLLCHRQNEGITKTCNEGTAIAEGEYIYYLDNDDYLYTEEFEKAMEELDGTDMVFVDAITNTGERMHQSPGGNLCCAAWFKFIRRAYLGDYKRLETPYGGDKELNDWLLSQPHTRKQTNLPAYHYNYPREGSVSWNLTHSQS